MSVKASEVNVKLIMAWMRKNGLNSQTIAIEMGYSPLYFYKVKQTGLMGNNTIVAFSKLSGLTIDDITNTGLTDEEIQDIVSRPPIPTRNDWVTKELIDRRHDDALDKAKELISNDELLEMNASLAAGRTFDSASQDIIIRVLERVGDTAVTLTIKDLVDLVKGIK